MNKKLFWITFGSTLGAVGLIASVGLGTYFAFASNNTVVSEKLLLEKKYRGVDIRIYHEKNNLEVKEDFERILQNFTKRIEEDLQAGPEFRGLNEIIISGPRFIESSVNGYYVPSLKKLVLNRENFSKVIDPKDTEQWVEILFQTFFHEYGHHIASEYFNTSLMNEWPTNWYNNFKTTLEYDQSAPLYPNTELTVNKNGIDEPMKLLAMKNYTVKSLGSVYSASDIFKFANEKATIGDFYDEINQVVYVPSGNDSIYGYIPDININWLNSLKNNFLYLYNMDELFTRKKMQYSYSYDDSIFNSTPQYKQPFGSLIPNIGWGVTTRNIDGSSYYNRTTINFDRQTYETQKVSNTNEFDLFMNDYLYNKQDNSRAIELFNEKNKIIGSENISSKMNNVSYITSYQRSTINFKNNFNITYSSSKENENKKDFIDIGGYLELGKSDYKNLTFIKEINDQGNVTYEYTNFPIDIYSYKSGYKEEIDSVSINEVINKYSWNTKQEIDVKTLLGQEMILTKDFDGSGNPINPINLNLAPVSEREVSSFRSYYGESELLSSHKYRPSNFFKAQEINGKLVLSAQN